MNEKELSYCKNCGDIVEKKFLLKLRTRKKRFRCKLQKKIFFRITKRKRSVLIRNYSKLSKSYF